MGGHGWLLILAIVADPDYGWGLPSRPLRYKKFSGGDALASFPMCLLASDIGSDIGSDGWPGILQLKVGSGGTGPCA
jgi:hypothetical protein